MKNNILNILEKSMLIVIFVILIFYQGDHELWLDELDWGIGVVDTNNLATAIETILRAGENLPLFYIVLFMAKSIFGFHIWMLTICTATIFAGLGIWAILKISNKILGKSHRIYTVFLIFLSYSIISLCGWQLRPYGLLFCLSSWMLYFYLEKLENNSKSTHIGYVILMVLIMYTHWYGILISLTYALIDLILFLKKKINAKFLISYMIAGLAFLPCFITILNFHKGDIGSYGVDVPSLMNVITILRFLSGMLFLNMFILMMAMYMIILNKSNDSKNTMLKIINGMILVLVVFTYIYSKYINPTGSIFRIRYFSVILPHSLILLSFGIAKLVEMLKRHIVMKELYRMIILCYVAVEIVATYMLVFYFPNFEGRSLYKTWAEYLKKQDTIYDAQTLVICTYGKTWIDLYFDKLPMNVISVNPLDLPNEKHMSQEDISCFKYFVKDGKKTSETVSLEDIKKYDTIYYMEEYRTISDEFKSCWKDYRITYSFESHLYKIERRLNEGE